METAVAPLIDNPDFDEHERVVVLDDPANGLKGVICIHSTVLGPAMGGCRLSLYESPDAALSDALRLSQGMSYKNAMAELAAGGGKAVLMPLDPNISRETLWRAFGEAVEALRGIYITAEDVGTTVADMEIVSRQCRFVSGLPSRLGRAGGDPSPWTALGVFGALQAYLGRPLSGARIAVQGLGAVGYKLCERLHRAGARLVVADIDRSRTFRAAQEFGAEVAAPDRIYAADADAFSPNALGGCLNPQTIVELGSPVVCGGANNQLASPESGTALYRRGVTYAPDYVVNAGGIINVVAEFNREPAHSVEERVSQIGNRVAQLLWRASVERRPPGEVADEVARRQIGRGPRKRPTGVARAFA
jgi:leucine dehydrogenase